MQREDQPVMETGLERIAAKARSEPKLRFTSLAHHITGSGCGRVCVIFPTSLRLELMDRQYPRQRRDLMYGLSQCFSPCTVRDIRPQPSGGSISPSPASRRSARWVFPVSLTGRSSAAPLRCCPPSMSRTFFHALLVAGPEWVPIMRWPPSMK